MSLDEIDPRLTQPKRLAALGVLAKSSYTDFGFLRDTLALKDSDLSKQMSALVQAGYATTRKTGRGIERQTWYRITETGRTALERHVQALRALVEDAPTAPLGLDDESA